MTEIKDVKVYDLEECIIASGYAMRTEPINYKEENKSLKHYQRCVNLVQASKNSDVHCHDNFLTGIRVSFDISILSILVLNCKDIISLILLLVCLRCTGY